MELLALTENQFQDLVETLIYVFTFVIIFSLILGSLFKAFLLDVYYIFIRPKIFKKKALMKMAIFENE